MFRWLKRFLFEKEPSVPEPGFVPREDVQVLLDGALPGIIEFLLRLAQALAEDRAQMTMEHRPGRVFSIEFEGHRTQIHCLLQNDETAPLGFAQTVVMDGVTLPHEVAYEFTKAFVTEFTRRFASAEELAKAHTLAGLAAALANPQFDQKKLTDGGS